MLLAGAGAAQASRSATVTGYAGGQLPAGGQAQALGSAALVLDARLPAGVVVASAGLSSVEVLTGEDATPAAWWGWITRWWRGQC